MVELISIHIPKTAGSTFFRILKQVYGKASVTRINTLNLNEEQIKGIRFDPNDPRLTRIIHGHLKISQMGDIIKEFKPYVVTWLRDPVDRVISNYYFSMQRIRDGKALERKSDTKDFSLLEYARVPENRNRASQLLDGGTLKDLFFVGIYEHYEKDLALLGNMLDWPSGIQIPHQKSGSDFMMENDCTTQLSDITTEIRKEIAILNSLDVTLYDEAKSIRK